MPVQAFSKQALDSMTDSSCRAGDRSSESEVMSVLAGIIKTLGSRSLKESWLLLAILIVFWRTNSPPVPDTSSSLLFQPLF